MDHYSLLTLLIRKIPLQQWETRLPSSAIHLLNSSVEEYLYTSIIILKSYSHSPQLHWLQHSISVQFLLPYRLHLFPNILGPVPPSVRLFHMLLIKLDTLVTVCILSWYPQNPKWLFIKLFALRFTFVLSISIDFWQRRKGIYLPI